MNFCTVANPIRFSKESNISPTHSPSSYYQSSTQLSSALTGSLMMLVSAVPGESYCTIAVRF
ncbi:hypothetical protein [Haladaptatus sp. DFWS20]|uniref:hypothetical protein n=1 Tax=Haladaptatus sp. DFWS20 TaxID=3403467 RepID=UPI003EC032F0